MKNLTSFFLTLFFITPLDLHAYDKKAYSELKRYSDLRKEMIQDNEDPNEVDFKMVGKDLRGANLNQLDLEGIVLRLCNFNKAKLVVTNFKNADLVGCTFKDAVFHFTDFRGADLRFTDFRCCIDDKKMYLGLALSFAAYLQGSDLSGANFMGTRIDGIEFDDMTAMLGTLFVQTVIDDYRYLPELLWERKEVILTPTQYRYHMRQRD